MQDLQRHWSLSVAQLWIYLWVKTIELSPPPGTGFPAAQGSLGCVQEVATEAVGYLPALPLYGGHGLCLSNTTHTILS